MTTESTPVTYTPEQAAALNLDWESIPEEQRVTPEEQQAMYDYPPPTEPTKPEPEYQIPPRPPEEIPPELRADIPGPTPPLSPAELARVESVPTSAGAYVPPEVLAGGDTTQVVEALIRNGASLATIQMYLEGQGKTWDDIDWASDAGKNIAFSTETINDRINDYNSATGRDQFEQAILLGFVPQGSEYVDLGNGTWGYLPPLLAKENEAIKALIEKQTNALRTLSKYGEPNGTYRVSEYIAEGGDFQTLLDAGFTKGQLRQVVIQMQSGGMANQTQLDAFAKLKDFAITDSETGEITGYRIVDFLHQGNSDESLNILGFDKKYIEAAKSVSIVIKRLDGATTTGFTGTGELSGDERIALERAIKLAGIKFKKGSIVDWQTLTPEEKERVAFLFANDPNSNTPMSVIETLQVFSSENFGYGLLVAPVLTVGTPIVMKLSGQQPTTMQIAMAGATIGLYAVPFLPTVIGLPTQVASAGIFTTATILNWNNMKPWQRALAVAGNTLLWAGPIYTGVKNVYKWATTPTEFQIQETQLKAAIQQDKSLIVGEARRLGGNKVADGVGQAYDDMVVSHEQYANALLKAEQLKKAISDIGIGKTKQEAWLLYRAQQQLDDLSDNLPALEYSLKSAVKNYVSQVKPLIIEEGTGLLEGGYRIPEMNEIAKLDILPETMIENAKAITQGIVSPRDIASLTSELNRVQNELVTAQQAIKSPTYKPGVAEIEPLSETIKNLQTQKTSLTNEIRLTQISDINSLYLESIRLHQNIKILEDLAPRVNELAEYKGQQGIQDVIQKMKLESVKVDNLLRQGLDDTTVGYEVTVPRVGGFGVETITKPRTDIPSGIATATQANAFSTMTIEQASRQLGIPLANVYSNNPLPITVFDPAPSPISPPTISPITTPSPLTPPTISPMTPEKPEKAPSPITFPLEKTDIRQKQQEDIIPSIKTTPETKIEQPIPAFTPLPLQYPYTVPQPLIVTPPLPYTPYPPKPPKPILPKPIWPFLPSDEKEKSKELSLKGAITWRQGFVWWIIMSPYKSKKDIICTRTPPQGATVVSGAGSAYKTIQKLTGEAPTDLFIDMGIFDVHIKKPSRAGSRKAIEFIRDRHQMSTHDLTVKGVKL